MDNNGFWGVVRQRLVPAIVGVAALLVAIAAVIYIVDAVRDERHGDRASGHAVAAKDVRVPDRVPDVRRGGFSRDDVRRDGFAGAWSPGPPMLGVSVEQTAEGTRVATVVPWLGAGHAGLEPGDLLLSLDGEPIGNVQSLLGRLATYEAGDEVALGITRNGAEQELRVTLSPGTARWRFESR